MAKGCTPSARTAFQLDVFTLAPRNYGPAVQCRKRALARTGSPKASNQNVAGRGI